MRKKEGEVKGEVQRAKREREREREKGVFIRYLEAAGRRVVKCIDVQEYYGY